MISNDHPIVLTTRRMNGKFFSRITLRHQTMGISEEKIEYGDGLRSEDNLFRAAQEGSVRRFEDEGIK